MGLRNKPHLGLTFYMIILNFVLTLYNLTFIFLTHWKNQKMGTE